MNANLKYLVIGSTGQLAQSLKRVLPTESSVFLRRGDADLSEPKSIAQKLARYEFDVLINAAAHTKVDLAEQEKKLADAINHRSVKELAIVSNKQKARFIHISTDFVFSGSSGEILPQALPKPINYYGVSKLRGDESVIAFCSDFTIIRCSWVYSPFGQNFVKTILRLANERDSINVVNDQLGRPTYAPELANFILGLAQGNFKPKFKNEVINFGATGSCSWYDFTVAIVEKGAEMGLCKKMSVHPIPSSEYPSPAKRPLKNILNIDQTKDLLPCVPWGVSLLDCLAEIKKTDL